MKLADLIEEVKKSDEYYLTTQYDFDDPDRDEKEEGDEEDDEEDEDDDEQTNDVQFDKFSELLQGEIELRVKDLFQPPLTNLFNSPSILPVTPSFFNLIPQQINLWMGSTVNAKPKEFTIDESREQDFGLGKQLPGSTPGSSSGLHHDHADNLYILVQGKKRFTILSPNDALKLHTVGTIYKIFNSGIIDYEINENAPNWKHVRDDGAIIEEILNYQLDNCEDDDKQKEQLLKELEGYIKQRTAVKETIKDLDPPSFSKVPPALLHLDELKDEELRTKIESFANKHFPGVLKLNKMEVWLEPGQMLYLPAGWFHEVSSYGVDDGVHIAVNYWFIPPSTKDYDKYHTDNYWSEDWERTKVALTKFEDFESI
ncbi:jmj4 JmjC domain-containing protein 4 [Candida maltosa Xu316]